MLQPQIQSLIARAHRILRFLALLSVGFAGASAQEQMPDSFYLRRWTTADGLPHNLVTSLLIDSRHYLWIGTAGGLSRFDGIQFKEHPLEDRFRSGGYNIRALALDSANDVLLLSTGGDLLRFKTGHFEEHPASSVVREHGAKQIYGAANGVLWIYCQDGSLFRWSAESVVQFGPKDGLPASAGNATFATDEAGKFWLSVAAYLGTFDGESLRADPGHTKESSKIATGADGSVWICTPSRIINRRNGKDTVHSFADHVAKAGKIASIQDIYADHLGDLWIAASWSGLFRLRNQRIEKIETPPANFLSLREDDEGNLWAGTSGNGLFQLRRKTHKVYNAKDGLAENISQAVTTDPSGKIWIPNQHGGLAVVGEDGVQLTDIVYGGTKLSVTTAHFDRDGAWWVGGPEGLFKRNVDGEVEKMPRPARGVNLLFGASNGDVWYAGISREFGFYRDGTLHAFGGAEGFSGFTIRAIAESPTGDIWAGTFTGELYQVVDGKLQRTQFGRPVHDIVFDQDGNMWIATVDGLVRRDGERFRTYTRRHGLADDMIQRLVSDDLGNLWFASRRGLFFVPWKELRALDKGEVDSVYSVPFGRDEGLASVTVLNNYFPSALKDISGRLWFATADGVLMVDPKPMFGSAPPTISVDEVLLDGSPLPEFAEFSVAPGRHQVEFRFSAPNYSDPDAIRVRYRLEGADPDWKESTRARSAVYSGLAPGTYRFQLLSGNSAGSWKAAEGSVSFEVVAAWWQRRWILPCAAMLSAALGVLAMRRWSQKIMRRRLAVIERQNALERELTALEKDNSLQRERARIARDLHDDLGSSITAIGLLAERLTRNSPAEHQEDHALLTESARELGADLHSIVWLTGAHERTTRQFAEYLQRYCTRFLSNAIHCEVQADILVDHQLPTELQHHFFSIVKEALINALKHSGASLLSIRMSADEHSISVVVEDDGGGFSPEAPAAGRGNGLANMRSRIAEMNGTLRIESAPGRGTCIKIAFPIKSDITPTP